MSARKREKKLPAVPPLTPRQIRAMDRLADAWLLENDVERLKAGVEHAAKRGVVTTPAKILKNQRIRGDRRITIALPPKDARARIKTFDEVAQKKEELVKVDESQLAPRFRDPPAKPKKWGVLDWLSGEGETNIFNQDPADILEALEESSLGAEKEEEKREEREERAAIGLLHPRDQARVKKYLEGWTVARIAEAEGVGESAIYECLARSERRIRELREYKRQCQIWAACGGERPDWPEIDDGASAEQLDLFALEDAGVLS